MCSLIGDSSRPRQPPPGTVFALSRLGSALGPTGRRGRLLRACLAAFAGLFFRRTVLGFETTLRAAFDGPPGLNRPQICAVTSSIDAIPSTPLSMPLPA